MAKLHRLLSSMANVNARKSVMLMISQFVAVMAQRTTMSVR